MTLHDHFRPPLSERRHWHAVHNAWATYIASELNRLLPAGYFAEPNVQFGVEIDVAAFEEPDAGGPPPGGSGVWTAAPPTRTLPFSLLEDVSEVLLFQQEGGPTLAAAVELVSPANKDRPEHREAFVSKCAAYLQQGLGLVIVDVVTGRRANLHRELVARLHPAAGAPSECDLYAVAYRPVRQGGEPALELWEEPLALGNPLPT